MSPRGTPVACWVAGVLLWLTGIGNLVLGTVLLYTGGGDIGATFGVLVSAVLLLVAGRFVVRGERVAVYGSLLVTELLFVLLLVTGPDGDDATQLRLLMLLVLTLSLAVAAWRLHRRTGGAAAP